MTQTKVIAVDLDGTISFTDTLHEAVLSLVRNRPWLVFLLPIWLVKGVAYLKFKVAENSGLDVTTLPYNCHFIEWLNTQRASGRNIVLCTAANEIIAHDVARHLDIFDDVVASSIQLNLKGSNKLKVLTEKYGERNFDYAGNSSPDLLVWGGASRAIVVNANANVLSRARRMAKVEEIFAPESPSLSIWLKALRVHQWLKNLLLFVPLLAAHQFTNVQSIATVAIAVISFSLCASSVYILNDLLDLESDRRHPRKKNRPFAAAKIPIPLGLFFVPCLIALGFSLGALVSENFLYMLLLYLSLTTVYSFYLKRIVLLDCLILATLFTVRIISGAVAVSIQLSFWLLAFSIFIFLSLALLKRYAELRVKVQEGESFAPGRGYIVSDAPLLQAFGVASGYISALVIALYVQSENVASLYAQPYTIWLVLPVLLFWVSWVWLKAERGEMHDDPIVFAARDKVSLFVLALATVIFTHAANGLSF